MKGTVFLSPCTCDIKINKGSCCGFQIQCISFLFFNKMAVSILKFCGKIFSLKMSVIVEIRFLISIIFATFFLFIKTLENFFEILFQFGVKI